MKILTALQIERKLKKAGFNFEGVEIEKSSHTKHEIRISVDYKEYEHFGRMRCDWNYEETKNKANEIVKIIGGSWNVREVNTGFYMHQQEFTSTLSSLVAQNID